MQQSMYNAYNELYLMYIMQQIIYNLFYIAKCISRILHGRYI